MADFNAIVRAAVAKLLDRGEAGPAPRLLGDYAWCFMRTSIQCSLISDLTSLTAGEL